VRFDASDEVSGGLSCALCVLDAHNNGFLVTNLYDLSHSRTFVRAVRAGRTQRELLPEEGEALEAAMQAEPVRTQPTESSPSEAEGADDA
jgi:hypothetical protein